VVAPFSGSPRVFVHGAAGEAAHTFKRFVWLFELDLPLAQQIKQGRRSVKVPMTLGSGMPITPAVGRAGRDAAEILSTLHIVLPDPKDSTANGGTLARVLPILAIVRTCSTFG
jgi:hypothetical protein